jgi:thioredoxin-dependent peroxiredoxin
MVNLRFIALSLAALAASSLSVSTASPAVGEKAPDFKLSTPEGKQVRLSETIGKGTVALVVLRGYPGYQCPYCNRQVQDFLENSDRFTQAGVHVLLVYPGPPGELKAKADEFLKDKHLPANFDLLLDPGYEFTNAYGLRWNAPKETAYPSTFLIDSQGSIFFSRIAKAHGGRTTAVEILDLMPRPRGQP